MASIVFEKEQLLLLGELLDGLQINSVFTIKNQDLCKTYGLEAISSWYPYLDMGNWNIWMMGSRNQEPWEPWDPYKNVNKCCYNMD